MTRVVQLELYTMVGLVLLDWYKRVRAHFQRWGPRRIVDGSFDEQLLLYRYRWGCLFLSNRGHCLVVTNGGGRSCFRFACRWYEVREVGVACS